MIAEATPGGAHGRPRRARSRAASSIGMPTLMSRPPTGLPKSAGAVPPRYEAVGDQRTGEMARRLTYRRNGFHGEGGIRRDRRTEPAGPPVVGARSGAAATPSAKPAQRHLRRALGQVPWLGFRDGQAWRGSDVVGRGQVCPSRIPGGHGNRPRRPAGPRRRARQAGGRIHQEPRPACTAYTTCTDSAPPSILVTYRGRPR